MTGCNTSILCDKTHHHSRRTNTKATTRVGSFKKAMTIRNQINGQTYFNICQNCFTHGKSLSYPSKDCKSRVNVSGALQYCSKFKTRPITNSNKASGKSTKWQKAFF